MTIEFLIAIGLILILTEIREIRLQSKFKAMNEQFRFLRKNERAIHEGLKIIQDEIKAKASEESVLALVAQAEMQAESMRVLLREAEQVAKYRSQPEMYDVIEGGI